MSAAVYTVLGEYAKRRGIHTVSRQRSETGGFHNDFFIYIFIRSTKAMAEKILGGRASTDIAYAHYEYPFKHLKALAESLSISKGNRTRTTCIPVIEPCATQSPFVRTLSEENRTSAEHRRFNVLSEALMGFAGVILCDLPVAGCFQRLADAGGWRAGRHAESAQNHIMAIAVMGNERLGARGRLNQRITPQAA